LGAATTGGEFRKKKGAQKENRRDLGWLGGGGGGRSHGDRRKIKTELKRVTRGLAERKQLLSIPFLKGKSENGEERWEAYRKFQTFLGQIGIKDRDSRGKEGTSGVSLEKNQEENSLRE